MEFNAEEFWATREKKSWVVYLRQIVREGRKKRELFDTKYVTAKTKEGAIRTAKFHSSLTRPVCSHARLATPADLGCTKTA